MKKFICALFAAIALCAFAFGGCSFMGNGADGKDGQDLNIYDIYEATNAARAERGEEQLSFLDFIREYLKYDFEYKEDDLQAQINRSLLSAVAIFPGFRYPGTRDLLYAAGSGVIVDIDKAAGDAYILTNSHVVIDFDAYPNTPTEIRVMLYGNDDVYDENNVNYIKLKPTDIVTYSISYDLALLKVTDSEVIKNSDARAAVFAESEDVYAGQKVYTVGNPAGSGIAVTTGIISKESEFVAIDFAVGTSAENTYRAMRTDAAANSGNSGGPLFDSSGRILGIINSKDASNENMSYALCGSYVKRLWRLMSDGYLATSGSYGIRRAVFPGVYTYTTKSSYDNQTNLTVLRDNVTIKSSQDANLKMGDVIKHIKIVDGFGKTVDELDITRFYNVDDVLISAREGCKVIYTVARGEETLNVECKPVFQDFV